MLTPNILLYKVKLSAAILILYVDSNLYTDVVLLYF